MGMDLKFYMFKDKAALKSYNAIAYEYNQYTSYLYEKYKNDLVHLDWIGYEDEPVQKIYTDEEASKLKVLEKLTEMSMGKEIEEMYGNSYDSMIPQYFRKYHPEKWQIFIKSHGTYFELSEEMIDDILKKTKEVVECPSKGIDILPPLDLCELFGDPSLSSEYRYGKYKIHNGRIYSDNKFSEDDIVYICEIRRIMSNFKLAKQLLNASPNALIVYHESL